MHQEHDKGFKELLGHSSVFAQLLSSFIGEDWTRHIDPDALELVPSQFITTAYKKREADIIYQITGPQARCYCIAELQSTVDYSMPIRLMEYMAIWWMELRKNTPEQERRRKSYRLPRICSLVLYNGKQPWTAAREFGEVCREVPGFAVEYGVQFKYHLVDVNRYTAEELLGKKNLLGAVFYIDQSCGGGRLSLTGLTGKMQRLEPVLAQLSTKDESLFLQWLEGIALGRVEGGGELKELLKRLRRKQVSGMVSNFAREFEAVMREAKAAMAERDRLKARIEQERIRAEQEKARAEQEKARIEQERVKAEQALRQTVGLMKAAGIPLETIAATTGLSPADLEGL